MVMHYSKPTPPFRGDRPVNLSAIGTEPLLQVLQAATQEVHAPDPECSQALLDRACAPLGDVQGSVMMRYNDEAVVVAAHGNREYIGRRTPRGTGMAWRVMTEGHEVHIFGAIDSSRSYPDYRCSVVVPMRGRDGVIGTLNVGRRQTGFGELDLMWLYFVGAVLAQTVRLREGLEQETRAGRQPTDWLLRLTERGRGSERRRRQELVTHLLRLLDLDSFVPEAKRATALSDVSVALIPDTAKQAADNDPKFIDLLAATSGSLLRNLGADRAVCDLLISSAQNWNNSGEQAAPAEVPMEVQLVGLANRLAVHAYDPDLRLALQTVAASDPAKFSPLLLERLLARLDDNASQRDRDRRRFAVMEKLQSGEIGLTTAARSLHMSVRQIHRLRKAYADFGQKGLIHRSRGRRAVNRISDEIRQRVLELRNTKYAGLNDYYFTQVLGEEEGIRLGRQTVRRILRSAGLRPVPKRRPRGYRDNN